MPEEKKKKKDKEIADKDGEAAGITSEEKKKKKSKEKEKEKEKDKEEASEEKKKKKDKEKEKEKEKEKKSEKKDKSEKKEKKSEKKDKSSSDDKKEKSGGEDKKEASSSKSKKEKTAISDDENKLLSPKKKTSSKSSSSSPTTKLLSPRKSSSKSKGSKDKGNGMKSPSAEKTTNNLQFDKLFAEKARALVDMDDDDNDDQEEDLPVDDGILPIPPPNNPPMDKITLTLKQPDTQRLTMEKVDPANTNIRMVREFLQKTYYRGNVIPRTEQRPLLYRLKPIFEAKGDYNLDDAKTLADHGLVSNCTIDLAPMHVYVISPSTGKSMVINNIDPMNDAIFEMRKLALEDGYPIEKLRVLHKEAKNKEIKKSQSTMTFFDCKVKHNHTLVLEWPKITLKIKIPLAVTAEPDSKDAMGDGVEFIEENGHFFKIMDFLSQTELDKVDVLHDFILEQTGIPKSEQGVLVSPKPSANNKSKTATTTTNEPPKLRKLADPTKVIADYEIEENGMIELVPQQIKINLVGAGEKKQTIFQNVYPNDTVETIKHRVARGDGEADGIPPIPKTNLSMRKTGQSKDLKHGSTTLYEARIKDSDELDVEKTKITIKVQLPQGKSGHEARILEIGVNPNVDNLESVKEMISDQTGIPKDFLPPLFFNEEELDEADSNRKVANCNIMENDVLQIRPITLNVNIPGGGCVSLDGVDPFNDTVQDVKNRLGPDELNVLPVEKQRLIFDGVDLDKESNNGAALLFEYKVNDSDILDLERSKINVTIQIPSGEYLSMADVDPRHDTLKAVKKFLSAEYYQGKDLDGTVPEDQLRPLLFDDAEMDDEERIMRDYGLQDDDQIIQVKGMTVKVIVSSGDNEETHVIDDVDPMNDEIYSVKLKVGLDIESMNQWRLLHLESDSKEIDETHDGKNTFYDHGVHQGHTLFVRRKPITISIRLPEGTVINEDVGPEVLIQDDGFAMKLEPDANDIHMIKKHIFDAVGFPIEEQKLNKILSADQSKEPLDVPLNAKLSSPEVNILQDCTLELEPMTIHVKTDKGKVISLEVLPFDTVESIKERLVSKGLTTPSSKQRLLNEDSIEIGGDENNKRSLGSDKSTLAELGVTNGQKFSVEKSKISLTIKMPNKMGDVDIVVDPQVHSVDQIREIIEEKTGLPKGYQQRYTFKGTPLDEGHKVGQDEGVKSRLCMFDLKENDVINLEATSIWVVKLPKKERFLIQSIDPMKETLFDLKKRAAGKTLVHATKQRMLHPETLEEYVGGKEDSKLLYEYGIMDGDVVWMEKAKLSFYIVLPSLDRLELTIDARKDDLQRIRDHLNKEYYENRDLPKFHLREMRRGVLQVLDDEPGETKLINLGICEDDDHVKLKPCFITIDTPTKIIHCPNADPFHDNLTVIRKFVKSEGKVKVDGLKIYFENKEMNDPLAVLYDLGISEDAKLVFK